jgi:hypothetical protein
MMQNLQKLDTLNRTPGSSAYTSLLFAKIQISMKKDKLFYHIFGTSF